MADQSTIQATHDESESGSKMFVFDALKPLLVSEKNVADEEKLLNSIEADRGMTTGQLVWDYMDVVDAKSSALLTHISIFAALAGILFASKSPGDSGYWITGLEFLLLCLCATLCLRCLRIIGPGQRRKFQEFGAVQGAIREMIYRRKIYVFCREAAGILALTIICSEAYFRLLAS